jgi:hypothetical protein
VLKKGKIIEIGGNFNVCKCRKHGKSWKKMCFFACINVKPAIQKYIVIYILQFVVPRVHKIEEKSQKCQKGNNKEEKINEERSK